MKPQIILLFALATSVLAGGTNDGLTPDQSHIAPPDSKAPFFLYSLDPKPDGDIRKSFEANQIRFAKRIENWPVATTTFFLYSLNPGGSTNYSVNTDRIFHGFSILGKAEIKPADDPAALLKTFAQGIREDDGQAAFCFNPRHGLRMVVGSATNDFVICFECGSVHAYGFANGTGFLITGSPGAAFNHLVDKYHLKKPGPND